MSKFPLAERSAFPMAPFSNDEFYCTGREGVTVRQYFACHLMAGFLAGGYSPIADQKYAAQRSVESADALIAALEDRP